MNPRRPTPVGPKPHVHDPPTSAKPIIVNYSKLGPIKDNHVLGEFYSWCIENGASQQTCMQYTRYLQKPLDMDNKWSRLAYKRFYRYIGREDLWRRIKVKRSGVDLYIPGDKNVLEALARAYNSSKELGWVYKLLVYSGLRLVEVAKVLNHYIDNKWIRQDSFYKYPLSWKRGSKQVLYMYTLEKPPRINITSKWVSSYTSKNKLLPAKYIRKWVATKMLSLGIPEEIINYIQGRIPLHTPH